MIEFLELTFKIRVIFKPLMIAIFQSCLLLKMRLSVVLEGRYTGYKFLSHSFNLPIDLLHTQYVFSQKKSFTFCYWTVRNANRAMKTTQRWLFETVVDLKTRPRKELTHTTKMGFPTLNLVKAHRLHHEGNFTSKNSEFWLF